MSLSIGLPSYHINPFPRCRHQNAKNGQGDHPQTAPENYERQGTRPLQLGIKVPEPRTEEVATDPATYQRSVQGVDEIIPLDGWFRALRMSLGILGSHDRRKEEAGVGNGVCGQSERVEQSKVNGEAVCGAAAMVV